MVEVPKDETEASAESQAQTTPSLRHEVVTLRQLLRESRDISRLSLVGLGLLGVVAFLFFARIILLPFAFALMLSFLFRPVVKALAYIKIPTPIGAALVILVALLGLGNGVSQLQKPAAELIAKAPESLKQAESKIRHLIRSAQQLGRAAAQVGQITSIPDEEKPTRVEIKSTYLADTVLTYTTSFLTGLVETIVLLYFLLAAGDFYLHKLVKVLPSVSDKNEVMTITHEVQHSVSTFLFTITVINVCLGGLVALGMYTVGMANPLLWGALASLLNFIPYFGPFTGVTILAISGLLTFDSVGQGLLPPLIYLGLHSVESNFVTPMVLGRRLTLNPVVIFLSLMFWMWLWGIPGALLAVPFLMTFKIICDHFKPLSSIGSLLSN